MISWSPKVKQKLRIGDRFRAGVDPKLLGHAQAKVRKLLNALCQKRATQRAE